MTAADIARAQSGRPSGHGWIALCPGHDDRRPSLSISEKNGRVLVHCFAGCSQDVIIETLRARGLWLERERRDWTPAERRAWILERQELERLLPAARYWRRAAATLAEQSLVELKAALFDPMLPAPDVDEIQRLETFLDLLRRITDGELVAKYRAWVQHDPRLTSGMIHAARIRERAEVRALLFYLRTL